MEQEKGEDYIAKRKGGAFVGRSRKRGPMRRGHKEDKSG